MWINSAQTPALPPQRIGVFIDYWYSYETARTLFTEPPGSVPPAWFGNVSPVALARHLVKMPLPGRPRSTRVLAGTHVVIAHFDPATQRGQAERVRVWLGAGAQVTVCPPPTEVPARRKGVLHIALASLVVNSVASGAYDTAIVFAGDPELYPMFDLLAGDLVELPSSRVERAVWVAEDRAAADGLSRLDGQVWCHRLGDRTFRALLDDRSDLLAQARRERQKGAPMPSTPEPPVEAHGRPRAP